MDLQKKISDAIANPQNMGELANAGAGRDAALAASPPAQQRAERIRTNV